MGVRAQVGRDPRSETISELYRSRKASSDRSCRANLDKILAIIAEDERD